MSFNSPSVANDLAARDLAIVRFANSYGTLASVNSSSVRPTIEISGMV